MKGSGSELSPAKIEPDVLQVSKVYLILLHSEYCGVESRWNRSHSAIIMF